MAVILGNKYQSKNRDNFRKITGLSEANEKIKPENMPRIYGGIGEVYFNGQSAAGSSTGNGGGSTGTTDPNGDGDDDTGGGSGGSGGGGDGGGSGGSGGSSGGSGGSGDCACVSISETDGVVGIPCCVSGVDCEDGTPIGVQLKPSGEPIIPCDTPPPPPYRGDDTIVIEWHNFNCGKYFTTHLELADMDSGAGVAEEALQQSLDTFLCIKNCGGMSAGDKRELGTASKNGKSFQYYRQQTVHSERCGNFGAYCNVITDPSQEQYNVALENWGKNAAKQYFVKDGKFYDTCDPYGKPPSDDPIVMCDENGNQYKVSPDGKIKAL